MSTRTRFLIFLIVAFFVFAGVYVYFRVPSNVSQCPKRTAGCVRCFSPSSMEDEPSPSDAVEEVPPLPEDPPSPDPADTLPETPQTVLSRPTLPGPKSSVPWRDRDAICLQLTSTSYDECAAFFRRNRAQFADVDVRLSCNLGDNDNKDGCGSDPLISCNILSGTFEYADLPRKIFYSFAHAPLDTCQFLIHSHVDVEFTKALKSTLDEIKGKCQARCYAGVFHVGVHYVPPPNRNSDVNYVHQTDLKTYPSFAGGANMIFSGDFVRFFQFGFGMGYYVEKGNADTWIAQMMLGAGAKQVRLGKYYKHGVK